MDGEGEGEGQLAAEGAAGARSKGVQTVFYSRVAALAEAVGNAPEWEGGGVVLVGHSAVCSIMVRELTGQSENQLSGIRICI